MSVILGWTPADCLALQLFFLQDQSGKRRGVLYIKVLPDFLLIVQYCANVLDMDQQCSKRTQRNLSQLNIGLTHPLPSSLSFFLEGTKLVGCSKHLKDLATNHLWI